MNKEVPKPYTGPIPPGAGVSGITLWSKERRDAWFKKIKEETNAKS